VSTNEVKQALPQCTIPGIS